MDSKLTYEELYRNDLDRKQLYRSLFEDNYSMMLLIDSETGAINDANPSACVYYGYTKEKLKNLKITDINTLSKKEVFMEMEKAKSEKRNHFNFKHRLSNGAIRDVEVFSGPITIGGKSMLCSIVHDISIRKSAERERERLIDELRNALSEVKTLRGFLPICASCKKIRDDKGYWNQIESYIRDHSEAEFTHSICPECAKIHYSGLTNK
jgi:PAS domain S-box-containing protein